MKELENEYVKRTQKDYSLSFKLAVVKEIENGFITRSEAMHKYGIQGCSTITRWCENMVTLIITV